MGEFEKLELSTETLRDLTGDELSQVAGGTGAITRTCALLSPAVIYTIATWATQQLSVECAP